MYGNMHDDAASSLSLSLSSSFSSSEALVMGFSELMDRIISAERMPLFSRKMKN